MSALPEIPRLEPIQSRPLDLLHDIEALREVYQQRIIELEDALRGVVGQIDLLHYSGRLNHDPRTSHRYIDAVEALR